MKFSPPYCTWQSVDLQQHFAIGWQCNRHSASQNTHCKSKWEFPSVAVQCMMKFRSKNVRKQVRSNEFKSLHHHQHQSPVIKMNTSKFHLFKLGSGTSSSTLILLDVCLASTVDLTPPPPHPPSPSAKYIQADGVLYITVIYRARAHHLIFTLYVQQCIVSVII